MDTLFEKIVNHTLTRYQIHFVLIAIKAKCHEPISFGEVNVGERSSRANRWSRSNPPENPTVIRHPKDIMANLIIRQLLTVAGHINEHNRATVV